MLKHATFIGIILGMSFNLSASRYLEEPLDTLPNAVHLLTFEEQEMPIFERITSLLQRYNAEFRIMEHTAEGQSDKIAEIRGHDPKQGAKAIVTMSTLNKKERMYHLAVLPGNEFLDFSKIKELTRSKSAMMAPLERIEKLTTCGPGFIPPISFSAELNLIVDPSLIDNKEIVFNAGRLDRSIFLNTKDYIKIFKPYLFKIIK